MGVDDVASPPVPTVLTTSRTRAERAGTIPATTQGRGVNRAGEPAWRWPYPLAVLAWSVYSAAGVWMADGMHYQIGDAVARMADARYMLLSRDPHLAAIGLYWMPLPVLGQLPFTLILSHLGHPELAGPMATAFAGALTVLVMARICRVLELSKPISAAVVFIYAFNPIMVWSAANALSEQWSYLGLAIMLLGYLRWSRRRQTIDLAVLAAGLAVVMLTRYEALLLAPIMAVAAALNDGQGLPRGATLRALATACRIRLRRWLTTVSIVILPTYYVFGLWLFMQYVIVRNPFYWYQQQKAIGHTTSGDYWLPSHLTIHNVLVYVVGMTVAIVPATVVVVPLLVFRRRLNGVLTGLGVVAGALVWPAIIVVGLVARESAGAPRYFEPAIVFVTVGVMWLIADWRPPSETARRAIASGLIGLLALNALIGTSSLVNHRRGGAEYEYLFFGRVLGHHEQPLPENTFTVESVRVWQRLVHDLDPQLAGGSKVLIDESVDFGAFIFTRRPDHYIGDSDRDYQKVLADPAGRFDYLMVRLLPSPVTGNVGPSGPRYPTFAGILADTPGGHWVKWKHYEVADLYHWVAAPG